MTLVARIRLMPSRRISLAERTMPLVGTLVAIATLVARWPSATVGLVAAGAVGAGGFMWIAFRRARGVRATTLRVADRATIDLECDGSIDGSARLAESTVVWPGFAMLALAVDDGRTILRRPVVAAELAPRDRHALQRFLLWSLRARGGARRGDAADESRGR